MVVAAGSGFLHPEGPEHREFLALGLARVDGEAARREAIEQALADAAEIGRALEHHELVVVFLGIDRVAQPEAGIVHVGLAVGLGRQRAESEQVGTVVDARRLAVLDDVDVDRGREQEARVEQVEGELVRLALPERLVRVEADVAVLVVGELFPARRHGDAHVFPGLLGQRLGQLADVVLGEGLLLDEQVAVPARRPGAGACAQRRDGRAKPCRRPQDLTP